MFPCKLPCRLPAFRAVWRGQPETEAALVDLKGLAAPAVIVHLLTMLRPAAGVGSQPVLQVRVVGADGDSGALLVKLNYSRFLAFLQSCFHVLRSFPLIFAPSRERGLFRLFFPALDLGKTAFSRSKSPGRVTVRSGPLLSPDFRFLRLLTGIAAPVGVAAQNGPGKAETTRAGAASCPVPRWVFMFAGFP